MITRFDRPLAINPKVMMSYRMLLFQLTEKQIIEMTTYMAIDVSLFLSYQNLYLCIETDSVQ